MSRLAVVHSVNAWLPQSQAWLYDLVSCLPDEIESHVVCEAVENPAQFALEHMHARFGSSRRFLLEKLQRELRGRRHMAFLAQQLRRSGAGLLHSHFGHLGWSNRAVAREAGLPHVVSFYGRDLSQLPGRDARWRARYAELFREVDLVLAEGSVSAATLRELGCPPEKLEVQRLGVRVDEIPFEPRSWRPGEPLRVLMASAFRPKKGIPLGLEALARIRGDVDLRLTIVGDAALVPEALWEKRRILRALRRLDLEGITERRGFLTHRELQQEMRAHHLFMAPSLRAPDGDCEGGAPVTLVEMAASGIAIVSTRHCDIPNVVLHEQTGLLAEEGSAEDLARQLRRLVADPSVWRRYAEAGRRHVEARHRLPDRSAHLAGLYARLVDRP